MDMKRTPLGGSLFVLDRMDLLKRQDGNIDLGTECGGDAACTTTSYGCECRFADESWASDLPDEEDTPPVEAPTEDPPPPSKNDPVDPPGKLDCEPTPAKEFNDAHEGKVYMGAEAFCERYARSEDQDSADLPIAKTLFVWNHLTDDLSAGSIDEVVEWRKEVKREDDVFDFKIELVEKCTTDEKLNLAKPVANNDCAGILKSAWKQCNNQGRGGSLVAGCLTYSIVTKF